MLTNPVSSALSGVVNAVLKRGGERFHWDAEFYTGGPIYGADAGRLIDDTSIRMLSQTSLQASVSGPIFLPSTRGLLSFRHALNDDWIRGELRFSPADRPDTVKSYVTGRDSLVRLDPTGTGDQVALGYTNEWSGVLKLSNRSISNVSLDWQAILNVTESRRSTWAYHLVPEGLKKQRTVSVVQGADWTHALSPPRVYTRSARQSSTDVEDVGPCKKKIKVRVPAEAVASEFDRNYREISGNVVLPGFRRGKVPRTVIEKRYGKEINREVKQRLIERQGGLRG